MKVLLCTPFDFSGKTPGGISVWAKNIYDYNRNNSSDVILDIYSTTRTRYINENTGIIKRIYYGIIDYFHFIRDIRRKVREGGYDVVHMNSTASFGALKDIVLCKCLKKLTKVFIHYHFGRIPTLSKQRNFEWKMVSKTISLAHKVIVMDAESYRTLDSIGYRNVIEIPNPYSPTLDIKAAELAGKVERKKGRVLYIGRVFRQKGIYELVSACAKLSNIELRIVGPYEEVDRQNLLAIAENASWIDFVGPVGYDKVVEELMSCEICCLPSYTEGFPNIVLECMVTKTPIVATPVGAIPEMLDFDGKPCGIRINPRNVDDIVNALGTLLNNGEMQDRIVTNGYKRVSDLYNVQAVVLQLYNTWHDII